jgi:hypothetical protein
MDTERGIMEIPIDQIIAYALTIISATLFIVEKRRNSKKPIYMALQGILKSIYAKFKYHNSNFGFLIDAYMRNIDRKVSLQEHLLYVQTVTSDYESLMESLVGIMKSLDLGDDEVFDKEIFTGHKKSLEEWQNKMAELQREDKKS